MATSLRSGLNFYILSNSAARKARLPGFQEWLGARAAGCFPKNRKIHSNGVIAKYLLSVGIVVLLFQSALATEADGTYEGSASTSPPPDPAQSVSFSHLLTGVMVVEEGSLATIHAHLPGAAESTREQPAFSSILTMLADSIERPQSLVQSLVSPVVLSNDNRNQTNQWPSEGPSTRSGSSLVPLVTSVYPSSSEETTFAGLPAVGLSSVSSIGEADAAHQDHATALLSSVTPRDQPPLGDSATAPASHTLFRALTDSPPELTTMTTNTTTIRPDVTWTTAVTPDISVRSSSSAQTKVSQTDVTMSEKTSTVSPKTSTTIVTSTTNIQTTSSATPVKTTPLRATAGLYNTSTTETPVLQCNVTEKMWVKTVLSVPVRGKRLDGALKQNLPRGLSRALQKALNLSSVQVQMENMTGTWNVTIGYYVISGPSVLTASAVVDALSLYGSDMLAADIRQFVPQVQSVLLPVAPWWPHPHVSLQVKTVLRFVGPGDDITSCAFTQSMEQRLESVFAEAQSKVLNSTIKLSVQVLGSSQSLGSQAVTLTYVVRNGSTYLNGTVSSTLLSQLSAELVGYFLFYPPLIIAEPLVYHNLNTSIATRDYWVITVLQYVDNSSLESGYQSFARLMEQRLAQLFIVAHQQGARFRRATTVGGYTVQMVGVRRVPGPKNPAEMTYYAQLNGSPLTGASAAKILNTVDSQTMALTLGYFVQLQAEPVVKSPPSNLWIIPAVLVPIGVVMVIVIIITAVLCRRNKGDFKTDLNPRTKTSYRRDASFYHQSVHLQPVQGFDYAKQHLGQQSGNEEALPSTQETIVLPLPVRDGPLSHQNGTASKKTLPSDVHRSEDGSVISSESGKGNSGRGSSVQRVPAQQKPVREEAPKRSDPYDSSSGSLKLITVQPTVAPATCSLPASSDRSQDSSVLNGEVSMALKQKSDIERYRNKLRLKAKQRAHCELPAAENGSGRSRAHGHGHQRAPPESNQASTYVKSSTRCPQLRNSAYRSRQSLSSPSPGATEMDLLVMGDRAGRGIRNSGYDAFRFTQLPDMALAAPPPPVPPRAGPTPGTSLRRSTSDIGPKARSSECPLADMHSVYDSVCVPMTRSPLPGATVDQHISSYSGNPMTAVYAIPANRPCCSGYPAATPPTSYRSPSWMSYPPEPEDLPRQWTGSNQCHLETIC